MIDPATEEETNSTTIVAKRRIIRVDFAGVPRFYPYKIPQELRKVPHWVCWKFSEGQKLPVNARTRKLAKVNDRDTWCSYSAAQHAWSNNTDLNGVGFMFSDPYVGIDLDHCRDAETGAIEPWAHAIIKDLASYSEVSPSGTGVHVIVKGRMRGERRRVGRVEIYQDKRYFTVTGDVLPGFTAIRSRDLSSLESRMAEGALESTHSARGKDHSASGIDFKLIARVAEQTGLTDADALEAEVRRRHRQHFKERDAEKGNRAGKSYTRVSVESFLKKQLQTEPEVEDDEGLGQPDMPEACLDGRLGEICRKRMADFPRSYAWMSLLAASGALVHPDTRPRCNLYAALVGPVGTGKSSCDDFAFQLMSLKKPALVRLKAGSAEGLAEYMGNANGAPRLLYPDELAHLLDKAMIEHSSFPRFLTTAFYQDEQNLTVMKRKVIEFNARLSILGGLVEDQFGDLFGQAATGGLYDRFLFGLCPSDYKHLWRDRSSDEPGFDGQPVPVTLHKSVFDERDRWITRLNIEPRVAELCLRAATICAGFNGQHVLSAGMLKPALALAEYQMRARHLLQPNPGENPDARCAFKIRNWLEQNASRGRVITRRNLHRAIHATRLGPGVFHRCLQNMAFNGEIQIDGQKLRLNVEDKRDRKD